MCTWRTHRSIPEHTAAHAWEGALAHYAQKVSRQVPILNWHDCQVVDEGAAIGSIIDQPHRYGAMRLQRGMQHLREQPIQVDSSQSGLGKGRLKGGWEQRAEAASCEGER